MVVSRSKTSLPLMRKAQGRLVCVAGGGGGAPPLGGPHKWGLKSRANRPRCHPEPPPVAHS